MKRIFAIFAFCVFGLAAHAGQDIRLTLQQGVPVTSADIAGAPSVCLEPYKSPRGQLTTFDGANWVTIDVAPSTYCLSASGLTANTNYDVVVSESGSLPVMAWSTAYADDSHPPPRALQDGVEVLASDHTKLVIGAVHVNSIGLLMDSHVCRCLSNYYQPVPRDMWAQDISLTWPDHSPSTGWEIAHSNAANQIEFIVVTPRLVSAHVEAQAQGSASANAAVGIGLNGSLGDISFPHAHASIWSYAGGGFPAHADYLGTPGSGHITMQWTERSAPSNVVTWIGLVPPWNASGIVGAVMN